MRALVLVLVCSACGGSQGRNSGVPLVNQSCIDDAIANHRTQLPYPKPPGETSEPPPSTPPVEVAPSLLEGQRISGEKRIIPDDTTKDEIAKRHISGITATFKICLDTSGMPKSVDRLYSSCFPRYDADIRSGMKEWRYSPYMKDGQPVPVCTAVTFIYTQK